MTRTKRIFMAAFAVLIATAYAMPALPVSAVSSASLSIVPRKNYTIEPGKSINDKLTVRNLDKTEALELNLRIVDFTFTDDGGSPKLMLAEDAPETTWSLKPYLTIPKTVTIEPKTSKTLDMSVAIPEGHGAGSYYSAIVYSTGSADGGNVGLSASGVTLVFTSIPGDVKEDLTLENFGAYSQQAKDQGHKTGYQFITGQEPMTLAYTLKNNGNVTESPVGSISLKDMFGKERMINEVNPNSSLALIGQTRTFTSCIKLKAQEVDFNGSRSESKACVSPGLWPGYYSATLNLFYGQNGNRTQEIVGNASFWYLPMWSVIVLAVAFLIISYYVWKVVRAIRGLQYRTRNVKTPRRK